VLGVESFLAILRRGPDEDDTAPNSICVAEEGDSKLESGAESTLAMLTSDTGKSEPATWSVWGVKVGDLESES
jgi:hypothetical protein